MEQWSEIRRRVLVEGVSKRQVLRETGMHWRTLEKILDHPEPPGYRRSREHPRPKLGPFLGRIEAILQSDGSAPVKQRHTAKRIFERLQEEGYTGGYTQVKAAVHEVRQHRREVFLPLVHRPGEAQMDVGEALAKMDGVLRKFKFFVTTLPYSDAMFVQAFERAIMETFAEAHRCAFEFFGGVPGRITYDNDTVLVAKVLGSHRRRLTDSFLRLQSHYLFESHFCTVRRPNEKGVVETLVGYARRNFLVPVPEVRDLAELNAHLAAACERDLQRKLRGRKLRKHELLREDQAAFLPLPAVPFEACRTVSTFANSQSLVRFDKNDYSVPVAHAHSSVVVKGFVDQVRICRLGQVIAEHARCWDEGQVCLEPLHYLPLLERKPGGLDHGLPFADWQLPACFELLRARLQSTQEDGEGTREYIRVLRLLEDHPLPRVQAAVEKALACAALTRDAIAQFLLPQEEWRQTTFDLDGHELLRQVRVDATPVAAYEELLAGAGGPA